MRGDAREWPITRPILSHTGRLDGDDTGYRDVRVCEEDDLHPDPMLPVPRDVAQHPVYALGADARICPYYPGGIGASPLLLLRGPALAAILEADSLLAAYGRRICVLDAWRSARVQARLWANVFARLVATAGRRVDALEPADWLRFGRLADDTASFCRVLPTARFEDAVGTLTSRLVREHDWADAVQAAREVLTFQTNWSPHLFELDHRANTAHGSGGACDLILVDGESGAPVNLGAPFDSVSPVAVIDWFEREDIGAYRSLVERDASLGAYLAAFGVSPGGIDHTLFSSIRRERRTLFHVMRSVGATYFSLAADVGEAWHFNLGNERGGNQRNLLPSGGNACHSLLRDVRDPRRDAWTAVWGNAAAHRLAEELGCR